MMKFECAFSTDVGKIRNNNEDNFYLSGFYKRNTEELLYHKIKRLYKKGVFGVFDGMGGEEYGEQASLFAAETLHQFKGKDLNEMIDDYVSIANKKICDFILENNRTRSGSTFAVLYVTEGKAVCYNIGDSRIYLFRNGKLIQLSEDHTRVSRMVKAGVLTKEQAAVHKDRHILTQHLGVFPDELIIQAYKSNEIEIMDNDIYLLCSDGLTDMLHDSEIENILKVEASSDECVHNLINTALEKGGKDNVTVGIIKCIEKKEKLFDLIFRRI